MLSIFRSSLVILLVLALLTGVIYPVLVTVIAQGIFSHQANGSIIEKEEKSAGSELIGQSFTKPEYFWSRLSATSPVPYNASASSGSNYGPLNPELKKAAEARRAMLQKYSSQKQVPVDLVTASGSGLDPHISPAAAEYQVARIAQARKTSEKDVRRLVARSTESRQFGVLGEPRVNVLLLNLALDEQFPLAK
jgi:K+-transporting ATPase ATPase C chain